MGEESIVAFSLLIEVCFVDVVTEQRRNSFPLFLSLRCDSIPRATLFWWTVLRVGCCSLCDSIAQATGVVVCFGDVIC